MAAAAAILEMKLQRLQVEKPHIIRGAEKQLEELEDQVDDMLLDVFPRRPREIETDVLRDLRSKAIEIILRFNFIIDTFISDTEFSILKFKQEIGSFSREIGEIVFKIKNEHRAFPNDGQPERARRGPPVVKESDVVGLEGDVEFLLNKVITTDGLSTICIVGMGGIGKTTLASILYHHPAVAAHFEICVWITLSIELSDVDDILKELIAQLWKAIGSEGDEIFYQFTLKEQFCELLLGRKCFIVLDDAWDAQTPTSS